MPRLPLPPAHDPRAPFAGWPNWSTWNVHYWLTRNESWSKLARTMLRRTGGHVPRAADLMAQALPPRTPDNARFSRLSLRAALREFIQ